jgi:hypothetical protein
MGLSVNFYCHPKTLREIVNHSWGLKTDCQNFWWGVFTPLEIMPRCSAAGLDFRIIPAGFNAPLEFLTGFTPE